MTDLERVKHYLNGPIASVSTPFDREGEIDYAALRNCVEFIVEGGSGTVLLTYGDSLYSILTDREIAEVTRVTVEQVAGRKLVVTAGNWWTGESVRFAEYCRSLGADLYMPLPPNWAGSCTPQTLAQHFRRIGQVMPVMAVTALGPGVALPLKVAETLLEENDNGIVAVKDDICGPYGRRLANLVAGRWAFLSGGRKENHLDQLPYGADAYLSMYMRFKPEIALRYWRLVQAGNTREAAAIVRDYDIALIEFGTGLGVDFDAVIHGSLELFGIARRWRRLPYNNLTDEQMEKLKAFYAHLGLI
ncbi:dihydrodipicolinate synthase family protein [Paenibacillus cymbidii]|uniref:dihydrodipicolinate synthase family protein n=1 Tax=Paenibacillus cymbidii TaxID=1639034 RepID=UPI00143680D5|nr:dihydrodipicolinate synthase family protein [Paenibacillus cymbidii]